MDNYYLNNAVVLAQQFIESTTVPNHDGQVTFDDGAEHRWNGDPDRTNAISRLRYHQMNLDKILKRIEATAPADADVTSWRY